MYRTVMMELTGSLLIAFTLMEEPPVPAENVRELTGYKVRTGNISYTDFNLWVLSNTESFDQQFISDGTMGIKPAFENELVIAAAAVETKSAAYKVKFKSILMKKDELNVYFIVLKEKRKEEHEGQVSMLSISKSLMVKKVNFFHDNVLVRSVPIVIVY